MQKQKLNINRELIALILINSLAVIYVFWINNLLGGKLSVRVYYRLFTDNELIIFILNIITLSISYLVTNYNIYFIYYVKNIIITLSLIKVVKVCLPIIAFIITFVGTYFVFHNYLLSMDEYAPGFQAAIFLSGKLRAVVAQPWQEFADSLAPIFTIYNPTMHSWYQGYLPVYAVIKTLFLSLAIPSATNPVLAALTVIFIGLAVTNIWPQEKNAPFLAMLLLMSSSQFLITSMTGYSWPAHLLLNIIWIYCYTHKLKYAGLLLPIIGIIALGVHNPFVHGLFAVPFLLRILRERPWKFSFYVCTVYLIGSLFWLGYWKFITPQPALESSYPTTIFTFPGLVQVIIIQPLNIFLTLSWQSLSIVLLAFFALRNWGKLIPLYRDLYWGFALTVGFYFFFNSDQGHGWGYRYIYGILGNLVLLAMVGWYKLREAIGVEKAINFLIVTLGFALFIQFPIRCVQAELFVRPFASAMQYLQSRPESFILMDATKIWYSQDFVRNDPFLLDRPKFFFSHKLSNEQREHLNKLGKVHEVEPDELLRFGLIRMEPTKIKDDQEKQAAP